MSGGAQVFRCREPKRAPRPRSVGSPAAGDDRHDRPAGGWPMDRQQRIVPAVILGVLLALGMYAAGIQLTEAVRVWKQTDRVVSVKGLSERDVAVDLV